MVVLVFHWEQRFALVVLLGRLTASGGLGGPVM